MTLTGSNGTHYKWDVGLHDKIQRNNKGGPLPLMKNIKLMYISHLHKALQFQH